MEQLLPLSAENGCGLKQSRSSGTQQVAWDYLYEPDAQSVIDESAGALRRGVWSTRRWLKTWRPSSRHAWWP
jgi:hypothetical protein